MKKQAKQYLSLSDFGSVRYTCYQETSLKTTLSNSFHPFLIFASLRKEGSRTKEAGSCAAKLEATGNFTHSACQRSHFWAVLSSRRWLKPKHEASLKKMVANWLLNYAGFVTCYTWYSLHSMHLLDCAALSLSLGLLAFILAQHVPACE